MEIDDSLKIDKQGERGDVVCVFRMFFVIFCMFFMSWYILLLLCSYCRVLVVIGNDDFELSFLLVVANRWFVAFSVRRRRVLFLCEVYSGFEKLKLFLLYSYLNWYKYKVVINFLYLWC